ncbi:MAG: MaoC family dehydratase [Pseudomonadota bacterium]
MKLTDLQAKVGEELGVSKWFAVEQPRIDAFADTVEDFQFIHVNPELAKATPIGGTVAHGFLTLSLLSAMAYDAMEEPEAQFGLNYGFEKVRFLNFVRSGSRVRGRFVLKDLIEKRPGQWQATFAATVEIEGASKPALSADWLVQYIV